MAAILWSCNLRKPQLLRSNCGLCHGQMIQFPNNSTIFPGIETYPVLVEVCCSDRMHISTFSASSTDNNGRINTSQSEIEDKDDFKFFTRTGGDVLDVKIADSKGEEVCPKGTPLEEMDASADVNMEASIATDDVIRAGGFGARDEIGSVLPVASDSTDFEASIRDARGYEEPQGEVSRPGLGWTGVTKGD
ncbi:hypothetical protein RIF29_39328 [Crotalaria pallida]|uniref:Uncharacterized protein n=1 Tax=Crotalaria pallida TaxID=3830 RepID=A0AAN9E1L2_CROPI